MYTIENYKDRERFGSRYAELRRFLQAAADSGCNEHFHWGRLDWMMSSGYLDTARLSKNALFRDGGGQIAGAVLFDTGYHDRWYLLHTAGDGELLRQMVAYVAETDGSAATVKANLNDTALCSLLAEAGFERQQVESVLELDLSHSLACRLPEGFALNAPDAPVDPWRRTVVTWRGFDNEGLPEELTAEEAEAGRHLEIPEYIKVVAIKNGGYTAHCGVWYDGGQTAYIEPVVTLPEHRGKGLGRAVVYAAAGRAKQRGAKRAIVLSDQTFYKRLGMTVSSQVGTWVKNGR